MTLISTSSASPTSPTRRLSRTATVFQSWKYFTDVEDKIRSDLQFVESVAIEANAFYYNISQMMIESSNNDARVGDHIRRGDIMQLSQFREFGYTVATEKYFIKASHYFISMFSKVLFVVSCGWEDLNWAREVFTRIARVNPTIGVVYTNGRDAGVDMAILSRCHHTIISTDTYS